MSGAGVVSPSNDRQWRASTRGPRKWGNLHIWQTNWGRPRGKNWKWTRGLTYPRTAVAIYGIELRCGVARWWIEVGVVTADANGGDQSYWARAMFRARTRRGVWRRAARWVELNEAPLIELLHKEADRLRTSQ